MSRDNAKNTITLKKLRYDITTDMRGNDVNLRVTILLADTLDWHETLYCSRVYFYLSLFLLIRKTMGILLMKNAPSLSEHKCIIKPYKKHNLKIYFVSFSKNSTVYQFPCLHFCCRLRNLTKTQLHLCPCYWSKPRSCFKVMARVNQWKCTQSRVFSRLKLTYWLTVWH